MANKGKTKRYNGPYSTALDPVTNTNGVLGRILKTVRDTKFPATGSSAGNYYSFGEARNKPTASKGSSKAGDTKGNTPREYKGHYPMSPSYSGTFRSASASKPPKEYRGHTPMSPFYTLTPRAKKRGIEFGEKVVRGFDRLGNAIGNAVSSIFSNYAPSNYVGNRPLKQDKNVEVKKNAVEQQKPKNRNVGSSPVAANSKDVSKGNTPVAKDKVVADQASVDTAKNNAAAQPAVSDKKIKDTPASGKPTTHVIRKGETLGQIAKKYGMDYRQLAKDNGISDPNLIIAGRKLNINQPTKTPKKKPVRKARTPLVQQVPLPPVSRQQVWDQANASLPNIDDILGL